MTDFREEFKIFEKNNFLDWAAVSPAPEKAVRNIIKFLDATMHFPEGNASAQYVKMDSESMLLKQEISKLLNCSDKEIAITGSSTSQGIQIAFESIKPQKGENIVTCDMEFSLAGVELQKWRKRGIGVKILKNNHGEYDLEQLDRLIDDKTKAVFLDSVTEVNGYRFDLETLSKIVHEHGAYLVLDSIQHMGALNLDTKKYNVDFIAAGGHKWLTSPFGIGVLYVNQKLIKELDPPFYGYMNVVEPKDGWDAFFRDPDKNPLIDYEYVQNAKKFEYGGTAPFLGIVGLTASVSLINSIGIEAIEKKIMKMKKLLIENLEAIGARIMAPHDEKNFSSITTFNIKKTLKEDYELVDHLNRDRINVSGRGTSGLGGIRVSIHYPNNEDDVLGLVEYLRKRR
ncbi:MAG: aminotransferase class V-fold PLP-dependent enzyme [Candidatus Parvarchaeota archaeon]